MDVPGFDEALHAHLCAAYLRSLRIGALRGLAVVSLPLWYQAATHVLPRTIAWLLGLTAVVLASLGLAYAVLECRWDGRARRHPLAPFTFSPGTDVRDDIGAGLLCAWGIVSLLPCAAALGSRLPTDLLTARSPLALTVIAARIVLEISRRSSVPRRVPVLRVRGRAGWEYAERVKTRRPAARATRA